MPGFAAAVEEFAHGLELERYTLLGHSFGARVALQHAIDFPGRARRLVASSGVAHPGAFDQAEQNLTAFQPEQLRERILAAFQAEDAAETPEQCRESWADQLWFFVGDPLGPARDEIVSAWRDVAYRPDAVRGFDFGSADDLRPRLGEIAVPTLVVTGGRDLITPPEASAEIAAGIPGSQLRLIEGAGHFAFAETPAAYFSVLERWLAGTA